MKNARSKRLHAKQFLPIKGRPITQFTNEKSFEVVILARSHFYTRNDASLIAAVARNFNTRPFPPVTWLSCAHTHCHTESATYERALPAHFRRQTPQFRLRRLDLSISRHFATTFSSTFSTRCALFHSYASLGVTARNWIWYACALRDSLTGCKRVHTSSCEKALSNNVPVSLRWCVKFGVSWRCFFSPKRCVGIKIRITRWLAFLTNPSCGVLKYSAPLELH